MQSQAYREIEEKNQVSIKIAELPLKAALRLYEGR
jgi:hypothetical protein